MNAMTNKTARDLLREVMKANPRGSHKDHSDAFVAKALESECLPEIIRSYFLNNYRQLRIVEPETGGVAVLAKTPQRLRRERMVLDNYRERMKRAIVLMDHRLTNGKLVREATFGEMAAEGGWCAAVGRCGHPNEIVGHKLTETDLAALYERANSKARTA